MGRIWSDQRRYETWLLVETAAAEAMAAAGIVPADAARDIRERGAFDIARIEEIEQITQHDVIAFTTAVAEKVGPVGALAPLRPDLVGRHRHGAGAADARGVRRDPERPRRRSAEALRDRAIEHRATPMIGRTHGVHAEPMTFGLKLALWYAELDATSNACGAPVRRSASARFPAQSARSPTCRLRSKPTSAGGSGSRRLRWRRR